MPPKPGRGRKTIHKGGSRQFTSPEEIQRQQEEIRRAKAREADDDDDDEDDTKPRTVGFSDVPKKKEIADSSSGDSSEDGDDEDETAKARPQLMKTVNPNRVQEKAKKVTDISLDDPPAPDAGPMNRKEREALDAQRRQAAYMKKHLAGETEEAQRDLARLELIRKQRAEAAAKREADKKSKEDADIKTRLANPGVKSEPTPAAPVDKGVAKKK